MAIVAGLAAFVVVLAQTPRTPSAPFTVVEASIADMRTAMAQGRTTSHEIVQQYLTRIAIHENRLNAAIAVDPRALADADDFHEIGRASCRERV